MNVKAVKGFSGFRKDGTSISMRAGESRDVEMDDTINELISIGYLVAEKAATTKPEVKPNEGKRAKSRPD